MKIRRTAVAMFVFLLAGAAHGAVTLVENGRATAVIVVGADASDQAREAARVLQEYIERISGARLEIQPDAAAAGARIVVGGKLAEGLLGIEGLSVLTPAMNEERFVLKTVGNDLVLAGNEHPFYRGVVYAAYELLERLGCRWFFPGAYGEVVPKRATLVVEDLDLDERPDFRFRNVWYSGWMPVDGTDGADLAAWLDRNKMTSLKDISLPGDGTVVRLAPPEKYFESHPHIYAVGKNGKRDKGMLCQTEPEAIKISAQTICDTFQANPGQFTFGFGPPDGHPMCYCGRCQKSNPQFSGNGYGEPSLSDVWFRFANAVAAEVYKVFPDRWVFTNGYANRVRPPEGVGPMSPNLGIQFAMLDTCTFHSIGDPKCWQRLAYKTILDRWTRDLGCVFIYDYDPGKALDGMPFPMLHNLSRDLPYFRDRGVWGFWTEGQNCWMVTHLNYYVRGRLMWDADSDVRAIVRDYCEKFYGNAADAVEDYVWTLEDAVDNCTIHETFGRLVPWRAIYDADTMQKLDALIEEAARRAGDGPEALHVRVLGLVYAYVRAYMAMEEAAAEGDFKGAVAQADEMLRVRAKIGQVDNSLIPVTPEWCNDGSGALEWHRTVYQRLAERIDGTRGNLVGLAPRVISFRKDPDDMGVLEQWYAGPLEAEWDTLDSTLYWEAQGLQDARGYGYTGNAWYRASFDVSSDVAGKPVMLTIGGIYSDTLWIWVNGFLVDQRQRQSTKAPFDVDVTAHVKPGEKNDVAILLETLTPDRNARGGLHRRVFLWSRK
ncbi:MAG TPA: DUF4838 domain-containing protein [Candidatus Bathyarchaeia archaeon]|nr:DUF4838 domain-containing protein [Candidatus Bathyarchaeia archaeon]